MVQILNNFLGKVECIAIGGGMIKEFAHYLNSKNVSLKKNNIIHEILNNNKTKILIPKDVMINNENLKPKYIIKNLNEVLTEDNIVDIGPKTIDFYSEKEAAIQRKPKVYPSTPSQFQRFDHPDGGW